MLFWQLRDLISTLHIPSLPSASSLLSRIPVHKQDRNPCRINAVAEMLSPDFTVDGKRHPPSAITRHRLAILPHTRTPTPTHRRHVSARARRVSAHTWGERITSGTWSTLPCTTHLLPQFLVHINDSRHDHQPRAFFQLGRLVQNGGDSFS